MPDRRPSVNVRSLIVSVLMSVTAESAMAAPTIEVSFPTDRAKCGQLVLKNSIGHVASGPFAACGVADSITAKKHKNPQRSTILPYGDTPTGTYKIVAIFRVGDT